MGSLTMYLTHFMPFLHQILEQTPFIEYQIRKEQTATRTKLKTAERTQSLRQVSLYADVLNELNESATNDYYIDEESEYSPRESTPSDANSGIEDEDDVYQFLTHSRDSYVYKLPTDSLRWVVSGHDVLQSFINYRNAMIKKAKI